MNINIIDKDAVSVDGGIFKRVDSKDNADQHFAEPASQHPDDARSVTRPQG